MLHSQTSSPAPAVALQLLGSLLATTLKPWEGWNCVRDLSSSNVGAWLLFCLLKVKIDADDMLKILATVTDRVIEASGRVGKASTEIESDRRSLHGHTAVPEGVCTR